MCGSSPPPQPDPFKTAEAQYGFEKRAAEDALRLNAIDQFGPFGSTTYQRDAEGLPTSQTVDLSPDVQNWLDSQFGASTALQSAAQNQLGFLPQDQFKLPNSPDARGYAAQAFGDQAIDPSRFVDPLAGDLYQQSGVGLEQPGSTQDIASTFYDQARSRFQPDLDDQRNQLEVSLAQRGIPVGSEIYNTEMDRFDRNQNNLYSDAARQAELAAGQEQSRQFGQNLSTAQYGGQDQQRLQSADLANRGFLGTQQNQQFNQLQNALQFGRGEYQTDLSNQLLERNQPYAEAAALLGSTPTFQTPSFQNTASQGVAAPDYSGLVNNNYAQQMAQHNADNSGFFGALGSIGSAVAPMIFSDENMKEDRSPADGEMILASFREMPVDDYAYKPEAQEMFGLPERRTGTMAQDYAEHFGGDGKTIDVGDAIGKLMSAMKALDARTASRGAA